jgi:hypothetical protein
MVEVNAVFYSFCLDVFELLYSCGKIASDGVYNTEVGHGSGTA